MILEFALLAHVVSIAILRHCQIMNSLADHRVSLGSSDMAFRAPIKRPGLSLFAEQIILRQCMALLSMALMP